MEIKITKVIVLIGCSATDDITLYTTLPPAFPKCWDDPAYVDLHVQQKTGIAYATKNFKMDIEVINGSTGERYTIKYEE